MKNPIIKNIVLMLIVILISSLVLLFSCDCNESCCCNFHISSTWENIIIGLISSALLLLLSEVFRFRSDRKLGYLEGEYSRTFITDVIANSDIVTTEKREEDLNSEQRDLFIKRNLMPIQGSRYVEVRGYQDIGKDWRIKLKYLHNGIYDGTAEYHKYWGKYGDKTLVKFTLTLNQSNLTTGGGNYKYIEKDDYGIYSFQVNEDDTTEILVTYKNTIPSGLAEGYEKWKRIKLI